MMENLGTALQNAVTETLENLAFMEAFPVEEAIPSGGEMTAALLLHEPHQGEIRLVLTAALLTDISNTIFGFPEEGGAVPDPKDLLAELLNTIAGRFLIELLPEDQPFRIGLPELDPPVEPETADRRVWHFRADDHIFTVSISKLTGDCSPRTGLECAVRQLIS